MTDSDKKAVNNITIDVGTINLNTSTIKVAKPKQKPPIDSKGPKRVEMINSPKHLVGMVKPQTLVLDSQEDTDLSKKRQESSNKHDKVLSAPYDISDVESQRLDDV